MLQGFISRRATNRTSNRAVNRFSGRASRVALAFFFLAILVVIWQAISLIGRLRGGGTDFSVFYNTAQLLRNGAGGEIYAAHDSETGWLRAIPPFGQAIIQPLAYFSAPMAAALWGIFNLVLLGACVRSLFGIAENLERQSRLYRSVALWMAVLLLLFAGSSVQVGQWSVFFVACWIFALHLATKRRDVWSGILLAVPAAIKIYPLLLLAIPFFSSRRRQFAGMLLGVALCAVVPFGVYGARTVPLTTAFVREVVLNPRGRVAESQAAWPVGNQGIDAVLLRVLSHDEKLTRANHYPNYPHLSLPREVAIQCATLLRLVLLLLAIGVSWRWRRAARWRFKIEISYANLLMAAFWCSTLFLLMPGAKARYSVYAVLGFWPILVVIFAARRRNEYSKAHLLSFLTILCAVCVASAVPESWRAYNAGFVGALALWGANLWLLQADATRIFRRHAAFSATVTGTASATRRVIFP